jgi:hypothetical protein
MTRDQDRSPFAAPPGVDPRVPSAARIYDRLLGGFSNFEVDREFADKLVAISPKVQSGARANRDFVMRAARELARQGYSQWIDAGCGLPTQGAVHEVVRNIVPDARVVYADNEPVAVAHGQQMVEHLPNTIMLNGDVRQPDTWLDAPETRTLLDFGRPIVVVLAAVLHFVPDDQDPTHVLAEIRERLPHGSRLIASHGSFDHEETSERDQIQALYRTSTNPGVSRTREEFTTLLTGAGYLIADPPGVGWVTDIYPEGTPAPEDGPQSMCHGALCVVP